MDDIPGLKEAQPLTHIEALELDRVPEHLIVIGGGYVGIELAQAMRRFGSKITIIERNPGLLHREDDDVAQALAELLRDEGVDTLLETRVMRVSGRSGESVEVILKQGDKEKMLKGTHLLVAAGRTPNTEDIGLERRALPSTDRGIYQGQ